ncbi:TspO/MBR family protein [Lachnospiraceae bacterium LCP25S3_G4]
MKLNFKSLIMSIAIPLCVGVLSWLLTSNNIQFYSVLQQPSFIPPNWLFPIVWTILYVLMGISYYLIDNSDSPYKQYALSLYYIQLILNFIWSLVFFNMQNILLAFFILLLLWITILLMILLFFKIDPIAAKLQIPYLLWVTFAGYLNLSLYLLNFN